MNDAKFYSCLTDAQRQRVRELRRAAKYTYRKRFFTLDETFFYNVIQFNHISI